MARQLGVDSGGAIPAAEMPKGDDAFGLEMIPARVAPLLARDQSEIESTIPGKFRGWSGVGTLFELENGQVWRQAERGSSRINRSDPEVRILRGSFGAPIGRCSATGAGCGWSG